MLNDLGWQMLQQHRQEANWWWCIALHWYYQPLDFLTHQLQSPEDTPWSTRHPSAQMMCTCNFSSLRATSQDTERLQEGSVHPEIATMYVHICFYYHNLHFCMPFFFFLSSFFHVSPLSSITCTKPQVRQCSSAGPVFHGKKTHTWNFRPM